MGVSLVAKTIRFDPQVWEFICTQAAALGLTTSEFIRGAALARAMLTYSHEHPTAPGVWDELYAAAGRALAEVSPFD